MAKGMKGQATQMYKGTGSKASASGPGGGRSVPMNKGSTTVNRGANATYKKQVPGPSNTLSGGGSSPAFRRGGIGAVGKPPGTPSTKTGDGGFTSHPFAGRNTPPSPVNTSGSGKGAKAYANDKSNGRP